jgi:hypothetical protein
MVIVLDEDMELTVVRIKEAIPVVPTEDGFA